MHLCYLGRGLFVELVKRYVPLQILDTKDDVKSIVVGKLSVEEVRTVDNIIHTGLGVSLDPDATCHIQVTASTRNANAGCEVEFPRVKLEFKQPKLSASTSVYNKQKHPITKEVSIILTPLPKYDLLQQPREPGPKELEIVSTPSTSPKFKPSPTQGSRDNKTTVGSSVTSKEVKISLHKLILDNPSQRVIIT